MTSYSATVFRGYETLALKAALMPSDRKPDIIPVGIVRWEKEDPPG